MSIGVILSDLRLLLNGSDFVGLCLNFDLKCKTHHHSICCFVLYTVSQQSSHLWTLCNFVKS